MTRSSFFKSLGVLLASPVMIARAVTTVKSKPLPVEPDEALTWEKLNKIYDEMKFNSRYHQGDLEWIIRPDQK